MNPQNSPLTLDCVNNKKLEELITTLDLRKHKNLFDPCCSMCRHQHMLHTKNNHPQKFSTTRAVVCSSRAQLLASNSRHPNESLFDL